MKTESGLFVLTEVIRLTGREDQRIIWKFYSFERLISTGVIERTRQLKSEFWDRIRVGQDGGQEWGWVSGWWW